MTHKAQFISLQEYGRANNKKAEKRSMRNIVSEAERVPANCPHVANAQQPLLIHGISPLRTCDALEGLASQACSANGNKLRKDARILLAGVMSYPERMNNMNTHPLKDPEFIDWLKQSRRFLREYFGDDFKSAVVHFDETHPHIHFYCHQDLGKDFTLNLKEIHPGLAAEQELRTQLKRKPKKAELANANSQGLSSFQDDFHAVVSQNFGHKRSTVKRKRLKQSEFKKQEQAQKIEALHDKLGDQNEQLEALQHLNTAQQQELSLLQRYVGKLENVMKNMCKKLGLNGDKAVQTLTPKGP
jgi:hypothetical protein